MPGQYLYAPTRQPTAQPGLSPGQVLENVTTGITVAGAIQEMFQDKKKRNRIEAIVNRYKDKKLSEIPRAVQRQMSTDAPEAFAQWQALDQMETEWDKNDVMTMLAAGQAQGSLWQEISKNLAAEPDPRARADELVAALGVMKRMPNPLYQDAADNIAGMIRNELGWGPNSQPQDLQITDEALGAFDNAFRLAGAVREAHMNRLRTPAERVAHTNLQKAQMEGVDRMKVAEMEQETTRERIAGDIKVQELKNDNAGQDRVAKEAARLAGARTDVAKEVVKALVGEYTNLDQVLEIADLAKEVGDILAQPAGQKNGRTLYQTPTKSIIVSPSGSIKVTPRGRKGSDRTRARDPLGIR